MYPHDPCGFAAEAAPPSTDPTEPVAVCLAEARADRSAWDNALDTVMVEGRPVEVIHLRSGYSRVEARTAVAVILPRGRYEQLLSLERRVKGIAASIG